MTKPENRHKSASARKDRCPLSLHGTGQWYKKIHGRFYYFGTDKDEALKAYHQQATYLHTDKGAVPNDRGSLALLTLCNLYLDYQESRLNSGEIGPQHYYDQRNRLRAFAKYMGPSRRAGDVTALDIQTYRATLINSGNKPNTINNHLAAIKALFHWAEDNQVIDKGPRLRAIKKVQLAKKKQRDNERRPEADRKQIFTPEEIRLLLEHATVQMQAMIWLGLNCGFGCTDVAELQWDDLDLKNGKVDLPRGKTGVPRNPSLWPETIQALQRIPPQGPLVFYTSDGNPWVRHNEKTKRHIDTVSKEFAKLITKAGIKAQEGTGFYTLRRTVATIAAKTKDPYAVQGILGHKDTRMASTYIQEVEEQTEEAVNHIRDWFNQ
jgi:integrase